MIVNRVSGAPRGDTFQPPASPPLALQSAQKPAILHAQPAADFTENSALGERDYLPDQLAAKLAEFPALNAALGQGLPTLQVAFAGSERRECGHWQVPRPRRSRIHDFRVDGDELTGTLDWERAHFRNPAEDLGYIRGHIERIVSWHDFLTAYGQAGAPDVVRPTSTSTSCGA